MLSCESADRNPREANADPDRASAAGWTERLLRVPLFWKLLLAHLGVVCVAVLVALRLAARFSAEHPTWTVATVSAAAAVLFSALPTSLVLRLALAPLGELKRVAAHALEADETPERLDVHPLADDELRGVVTLVDELFARALAHRRQLRELAARALGSAEAERRRVGLLLQDRVAQHLASALVQLRLHVGSGPAGRRTDATAGGRARDALVEALEEVRSTARALRPPELEELGLERAVTALLRETREDTDCEILGEVEPVDGELSHPAALALFRILQEALLGALRETGSGRVRVALRSAPGVVTGEVTAEEVCPRVAARQDESAEGPGLGLLQMRERARFVGGTVTVEAIGDGNSRLRVTVPTGEASPSRGR